MSYAIHICESPAPYRINAGGRDRYFVLPPYCGLVVTNKHGDELKDPPLRDPFWKAVELWCKQDRKVDANGLCIWDADLEVVPITKHLGGRHYEVTGWETVGERRARSAVQS